MVAGHAHPQTPLPTHIVNRTAARNQSALPIALSKRSAMLHMLCIGWSSNKPFTCNTLTIGLSWRGIFAKGIEKMIVSLHLNAISILNRTQASNLVVVRLPHLFRQKRWPDYRTFAGTSSPGGCIRLKRVKRPSLLIGQDRLNLAFNIDLSNFHAKCGATAVVVLVVPPGLLIMGFVFCSVCDVEQAPSTSNNVHAISPNMIRFVKNFT
jgi:hypothetical protein